MYTFLLDNSQYWIQKKRLGTKTPFMKIILYNKKKLRELT